MDLGDCLDILVSRANEVLADPASVSDVAEQGIEAVGVHLWESSGIVTARSELLHAHAPEELVHELSSLLLNYIGYAVDHAGKKDHDGASSGALARAAEISMGILCNLVTDSRTAAVAWTTVLHVISAAESAQYPWTSHAPLAAALLQCLAMFCTAEGTKDAALEYMLSNVEVWMRFMLSGKQDVALWSTRLMYTCAASSATMQRALHEAAVMFAIDKLLDEATRDSSQEVDSDSHAVVAACELLDVLLDSDTMALDDTAPRLQQNSSPAAEESASTAHDDAKPGSERSAALDGASDAVVDQAGRQQTDCATDAQQDAKPCLSCSSPTEVPVELACRLVQHLVQLLKSAERSDTLVCCIVCLSRLHALEGEPPSELAQCLPGEAEAAPAAGDAGAHACASKAGTAGETEAEGAPQPKAQRRCRYVIEPQCSCTPGASALWSVLSDALAVRRLVSAAVTVISGGLAGAFWPHLAAALTVLTWVAAALARAAGGFTQACHAVRLRQHGGAEQAHSGSMPAEGRSMHWHRVCVHGFAYPSLAVSKSQWRDAATAFVEMVAELQDDLLVGLAVPFEGCDAGTSHVLRCTKIMQDVLDREVP
eukprot:jgi/Ulvmu1/4544/UM002_0270.1